MKKIRHFMLVAVLFVASAIVLSACGKTKLTLSVEDGISLIKPGDSVQLISELSDKGRSDEAFTYHITGGANYATIDQTGLLTVDEDAAVGEKITVVSFHQKLKSNEVVLTVAVIELTSIEIELNAETNVVVGGSQTELVATLTPSNTTSRDVEWIVVEENEFATIENNVLTVSENVGNNDIIKVQAKVGDVESNVLELTTLAKLNVELTLTTENNAAEVKPGETLQLSTEIDSTRPDYVADNTLVYEITKGAEHATITQTGFLTLNQNAVVGETIEITSRLGDYVSNKIVITVQEIALESITISANKLTVNRGSYVDLSKELNPANTTVKDVRWEIVAGADVAEINNNTLLISPNAESYSVIKIIAKHQNITSNELVITVNASPEDVLRLSFTQGNIELDSKSTSQQPKLEVMVEDGNWGFVDDKVIVFEVIEGEEFVSLTPNGYIAELNILGHGTARVRATIEGTNVSRETTVNVIVPPTAIGLPEKFNHRIGYEYNYSKKDNLPFVLTVLGNKVAQDFDVSFEKDGVVGDYATYENGTITFNTTGKIKVIATSNSGSRVETKTEYTFNINNGKNVSTFTELKELIEANTSDLVINVTEDITLPATFTSTEQVSITAWRTFNSLTINGNKYTLDASNLQEVQGLKLSELIDFDPISAPSLYVEGTKSTVFDEESINKTALQFRLNIYDYALRGNGDINNSGDHTYNHGLRIGRHNKKALYFLHLDGVISTGFTTGITIEHAQNGLVENTTVGNNYSTGINVNASIITFKNMTYGLAGATGIEVAPDSNMLAGASFNQNQRVTFEGTIETTNYNDGDTPYLRAWGREQFGSDDAVSQLVIANFGYYVDAGTPNVYKVQEDNTSPDPRPEFVFIAFVFHGSVYNNSELIYANADMNGIIDIADMESFDNVYQYVLMDILNPSGANLGQVLLYNQNYGKTQA